MSRVLCLLTLLLAPSWAAGQSFRVYTRAGSETTLEAVAEDVQQAEVVFLGEVHDDSVGHVLQDQLLALLLATSPRPVTLSLEMFERDVQIVLDEYLSGLIPENQFLRAARPWPRYDAHYRPLVEQARAAGRPVLAANAPRRYANLVAREGAEALNHLSAPARATIAPLPFVPPSTAYQAKWDAAMGGMGHGGASGEHAGPSNMLLSQALWDATMAHTIAEHLMAQPDALVVHVVGSFHVEGRTGTPEALLTYRPGTDARVVIVKPVEDVSRFDASYGELGDYVILTDAALLPPRDF